MIRILLAILAVLVVVIVAGGIYLTTFDVPAPTKAVEKIIPNDRFQH